ncbi:MAG: argininosuccinate lyase [bacterium]|nr:argininosuccinate lyase [bacterium]
MAKMWEGLNEADTSAIADGFNSSIAVDHRMYREDINGSIAHARMLAKCGIIEPDECESLVAGLAGILSDIDSGKLPFDPNAEDIHMFVEQVLTERIGEIGKKLHTARSRNDQVALDLKLYLIEECRCIEGLLKSLVAELIKQAEENIEVIVPGYTHLQRAQPIFFSHHLMAYAMMFLRDIDRIRDCIKRMGSSPIGACALAGTTFDTDRKFEAGLLGFDSIALNSIDAVSDRDHCIELASDIAMISMHLSRLSEELVLWQSWEFKYIELSDAFTTGSSIMPQKKNPDMAELVRGKSGRIFGNLISLLVMLKGLPLAYNKDMQEDKEAIFDSIDTIDNCLKVFIPMIETMKVIPENMLKAAQGGFINATDLADYLVRKGLPFRSAYKISGQLVRECIETGQVLEKLPLEAYQAHCDLIEDDVYDAIDLKNCVERRISAGGTSKASVLAQIEYAKEAIA